MELSTYNTAMNSPAFPSDTVHVWFATLDVDDITVDFYRELLDQGERERASRFHFNRDSRRYIVSHGVLRSVLAMYMDRQPAELHFDIKNHGKPALAENSISFNLSHSGAMAAVAVAHHEVGIDVECLRPINDSATLAVRFLDKSDAQSIDALRGEARDHEFLRLWTRKEARLKALGLGLSGLTAVNEHLDCHAWKAFELQPGPGYVATAVVKANCTKLEEQFWHHESPLK